MKLCDKLDDKDFRKAVMERYLEAETSLEEERALVEHYLTRPADEDESEFARLLLSLHLPEEGMRPEELATAPDVAEFDRMTSGRTAVRPRRRFTRSVAAWSAGTVVAVAVSVVLSLNLQGGMTEYADGNMQPEGALSESCEEVMSESREEVHRDMNAAEMTGLIARMSALYGDSLDSFSAVPSGSAAFITARLSGGETISYLMTRDDVGGSVTFTVLDNSTEQQY